MTHATREQARRLLLFVASVLVAGSVAVAPLAAQACLHEHNADAPGTNGAGRLVTPASAYATASAHASADAPMAAHGPMAKSEQRAELRAMSIGSHGCCDGGEHGQLPSCPTCPPGGTCSAHGPVTAIHDGAPAGVHSTTVDVVTPTTDSRLPSWSGSVDTPPPRS